MKESEKKISIIIPCHNSSGFLNRPWKSLLAQTMPMEDLEIFFVDDASDDGGRTWDTLTSFEKEYPDSVAIMHLDENMRQGGARNAALPYASGQYLMFLDSDDALRPDACEKLFCKAEAAKADLVEFSFTFVMDKSAEGSADSGGSQSTNGGADSDGGQGAGGSADSVGSRSTAGGVDSGCSQSVDDNLHSREELCVIESPVQRRGFLLPFPAEKSSPWVNSGALNKFYRSDFVRKTGAFFAEHTRFEEPLFVYPQLLYANRILLLPDHPYLYFLRPGSTVTGDWSESFLESPDVKIQLLENLLHRTEQYQTYHEEIEFYMIWSLYMETLEMAGRRDEVKLPAEAMVAIQQTIIKCFPDFEKNTYLAEMPVKMRDFFSTIREMPRTTQDVEAKENQARRALG